MTGPPTTPRLTVDTIVLDQDKVLLIRRGHPPFQDTWALPGGFVDPGETVEQAAVRETLEETGLQVRLDRLLGVYSEPDRDPRGHTVSVVFVARLQTGEDPEHAKGGDDAESARWFPLERTPELAFDHAKILEDLRTKSDRPVLR
jgi:8-oxo-dGTP diphosphatase